MARKLKSDKLLFTATLLLVCASVVMVYSASAVIGMDRYQQPDLFLFKQATFVLLGLVLMPLMMRIDYRHYRQPVVLWTALGVVAFALIAVLFGPHQWRPPMVRRGRHGRAALRVREARVVFFVAAILERRMDRIDDLTYSLAADRASSSALVVALIMLQPDLGTALSASS